jgi:hypothetical protein
MVIEGRWVMSEEEVKRHQGDALLALREARQELNLLLATAGQMSKKFYRVAELLRDLKTSTSFPRGPAVDLLQLPVMDYGEPLNLAAVKALANAIVSAQKRVAEASQHARDLGLNE